LMETQNLDGVRDGKLSESSIIQDTTSCCNISV